MFRKSGLALPPWRAAAEDAVARPRVAKEDGAEAVMVEVVVDSSARGVQHAPRRAQLAATAVLRII